MAAGVRVQELQMDALGELSGVEVREELSKRALSTEGTRDQQVERLRRAIQADGPRVAPEDMPDASLPPMAELGVQGAADWLRDRGVDPSAAAASHAWQDADAAVMDGFCLAAQASLPVDDPRLAAIAK